MKKTLSLLMIFCCVILKTNAQGTLKTALSEIKSQKTYDTLVYFGVDFSKVRINDAPKMSRSTEYSQVYPPAWISFIEKELLPDVYVRKVLRFPNFIYAQREIYDNSIKVEPGFIIGYENSIPIDTLNAIVSAYTLQSKVGLGLVLIPETFSKPSETATTWVVFFDIPSRHVVFKTKIYGKCDHMGYTAHWASGVVEGFKYFVRH